MKRVLVVALAAAGVFAQAPQKSTAKPTQDQKQAKEETTPQKDPVCGMTLDPKTADAKYAYKGKTYYFCSKEDQQEFTKNPDKYAIKK
jgi:YHS domain-containing protein